MLKAKTKKSVQSLTLLQVVKIVESINLKQIPMDKKNHELLKKISNKGSSLVKNHEKISIAKGKAERIYDHDKEVFRNFSYYESNLEWRK